MYLQYTNIIFYTIEKLAICRLRRCLSVIKMSVLQYAQIINRLMGITGVVTPPQYPQLRGGRFVEAPPLGAPSSRVKTFF